ncbi:hypothetical protein BH11PSE11_BH11PSE11_30150 [soil metagenome]
MRLDLYPEASHVLASRQTRLLAAVLDFLLFIAVWMPGYLATVLLDPVIVAAAEKYGIDKEALFVICAMAIPGSVLMLAQTYYMARHSQSIGKHAMKICVVRLSTGERCGFARYFWLRSVLCWCMDLIIPLFGLVDPLMIFSEGRRCIHDRMADTIVVKVQTLQSVDAGIAKSLSPA